MNCNTRFIVITSIHAFIYKLSYYAFSSVIEIIENEEYRVEFKSGGRHMSVCVLLGPGFPVDKPRLLIRPIVQHSWIQQMTGEVIDAPGLLNVSAIS